jgi:superfamily II DNA helicase RecQ
MSSSLGSDIESTSPLSVAQSTTPILPNPAPSPVHYLRVLQQYGVILCTEHQRCFTPSKIERHLQQNHHVPVHRRAPILQWINGQAIPSVVTHPTDYTPFITDLQSALGYYCSTMDCDYRSISADTIRKHASGQHRKVKMSSDRQQQIYSRVTLQWLFAKTPVYFIVTSVATQPITAPSEGIFSSSPPPVLPQPSSTYFTAATPARLALRFSQLDDQDRAHYRQIGEPQHVSEITPWLKKTGFDRHLAHIDGELIISAATVPAKVTTDGLLWYISQAVSHVLTRLHDSVDNLHHVDARTINTFQFGTVSQDPMQGLQDPTSVRAYIAEAQSLICYFIRVVEQNHFNQEMFTVTTSQRTALTNILTVAHELETDDTPSPPSITPPAPYTRHLVDEDEYQPPISESESENENGQRSTLLRRLDQHVFELLTALLQQDTGSSKMGIYTSAVISFCAVRASRVHPVEYSLSWRPAELTSGMLSKLIYCCQLVILGLAHHIADSHDPPTEFSDELLRLCQRWVVNNTRGPISALNDWRLLAMKIGSTSIPEGLVVWDEDGETLIYGEVRYGLSDLRTEMQYCWDEAQQIFYRDLCMGFDEVPTYPLRELADNWSTMMPGYSFINDSRNEAHFEGHTQWLTSRIYEDEERAGLVFQSPNPSVASGEEPVRSDFARHYQQSVIRFLEVMLVLIHKGSGQPARRKEFLGLRWRNMGTAPRNLRLLSGNVLFILTYHKSLHRTHASRSPVRYLPPAVAQLLVQYLVLIQPFRRLCAQDTNIPDGVGEYLWSDATSPWVDDRMTRTVISMSECSIGRKVNIKVWRQICVAIAVKKFSGMHYEADTDIPGNTDDVLEDTFNADGITLAPSFHAQTAHSTRTGNSAYGGSVNFSSSLTDAGVQVYLWTSQLWWTLFNSVFTPISAVETGKRARPASMATATDREVSLLKRVAHSVREPRHRRQFGREMVLSALRRLYCDPNAAFRSSVQEVMVTLVAARQPEVVVVLATGGGKSLAFMVPLLLPQSGTTVVVVPLVALKSDLVRRCYAANIQYSIWDGYTSAERYSGTPLLFVAAESAVRQPFQQFLGRLDALGQLDRIVIDECHLVLTASTYRPKLALLRQIRAFRCSVIFLTATLPPSMMDIFTAKMLLDRPQVVRDITFRADLTYDIHQQRRDQPFEEYTAERVLKQLEAMCDDSDARIIVYTGLKEVVRKLAQLINCEYYYSNSGTLAEKEQVVARWRDGIHRVIVATSAFGTGVDYAHVRMVVHHDSPRDAIDFMQEVGRLGRDGQGGKSMVVLPRTFTPITDKQWEEEWHQRSVLERIMQRYTGENRCLGAVLSRFFDGVPHTRYCRENGEAPRCRVCLTHGVFNATADRDWTYYWDTPRTAPFGQESTTANSVTADFGQDGQLSDDDVHDTTGYSQTVNLTQGSQRLTLLTRTAARAQADYLYRCRAWQGVCLICRLLVDGDGRGHTLDTCRQVQKWEFINLKKKILKDLPRGWIKEHTACWHCGQPPTICDGRAGRGQCEFRDMVFPAAWAMYTIDNLWGHTLEEVSGQPGGFTDAMAWMRWLGQECEVFGDRSIQAVRMLAWILARLDEGIAVERVSVHQEAEFQF